MKRCSFFQTPGRGAWLSVLLVLAAGLACVRLPVDYAREHAKTLAPRKLEVSPTVSATGPVRKLRVRVYADADYREQVLRWRSRIVEQLRRASDVVRGPLGVTFELESTRRSRRWRATCPPAPRPGCPPRASAARPPPRAFPSTPRRCCTWR